MPKVHRYEGEKLTVLYDVKRCIHAAECVHGLPGVFDAQSRPWVTPDAAGAGEVAEVIERCPSGALHYERRDGGAPEMPDEKNTIAVTASGPLYLRGMIDVAGLDRQVLFRDTRMALCRCGASKNKPFCDQSHKQEGFADPGLWQGEPDMVKPSQDPVLTILCRPNGPLILEGEFEMIDANGQPAYPRQRALCRCGGSYTKPFCDGSHGRVGFDSSNPVE
ncbi:MAG TPA: CDGSH iron-sulfur domain-containing protein [Thermoanaerobaculia bacterium]|nr:CDGSH iron-sulfur domain-containing protein [Thermoanaerobaculia bacterium]